jgi:hypothetical protein
MSPLCPNCGNRQFQEGLLELALKHLANTITNYGWQVRSDDRGAFSGILSAALDGRKAWFENGVYHEEPFIREKP